MNPTTENLLRWLWLINGVLVLILMVILGITLSIEMVGDLSHKDRGIDVTPTEVERGLRAVRFEPPRPIHGSPSQLIMVRYATGDVEENTDLEELVRRAASILPK